MSSSGRAAGLSDGRGAGRSGTPWAGSPRPPALSPWGEGAEGDSGGYLTNPRRAASSAASARDDTLSLR